jgi:spore maturation protein CgeB
MRFVIFGLTLSSSWGNGHATLWRGLLKALAQRGHRVTFFEKDVPYYADTRDGWPVPEGVTLRLFGSLAEVRVEAEGELRDADVAIVTSYCGEGDAACELVLDSAAALKVFYDLDTPVTLDALQSGLGVPYLPEEGLSEFDLVLSYTGGRALRELETKLGAERVAPLYGWVDPENHAPAETIPEFRSELSYLGTYAEDRQATLEELFVETARARPETRFAIAGAKYPQSFPWAHNIFFVRHLPPSLHAAFFCSGRATLNVTRGAMAAYGYCPSGRLFEAAACGTPILTDVWEGLETFFRLGTEVLPVRTCADVLEALALSDSELRHIGEAARQRTLEEHTAMARAIELERILHSVYAGERNATEAQSPVVA